MRSEAEVLARLVELLDKMRIYRAQQPSARDLDAADGARLMLEWVLEPSD